MRFHRTEPARRIESAEAEEAGWETSPLAHGIETAPGVELDPEVAARGNAVADPAAEEPAKQLTKAQAKAAAKALKAGK
jgi:hypothetical protein